MHNYFFFYKKRMKMKRGREYVNYRPDAAVPQWFSTPSTAAAIAFPFSAALSIRAIASYRHLAMSSSAMTSPFSTTGRCLNLPGNKRKIFRLH